MRLSVNQLIRWNGDLNDPEIGRVERILFIDETGTDLAAIDVDKKEIKTIWYKYQDIKAALDAAEACVLQADHRAPPPPHCHRF